MWEPFLDYESEISIKYTEFNLYLVNVYANSRKDRYYVFTTPECAEAIDDYFAYRKRFFEEIKDSSPLNSGIRFQSIIHLHPGVAKPIGVRALQLIIKAAEKEAGVLLENSQQVMRTHGFRKLNINQLDKAGVHFSCREFLAGHKLPGQDSSYVRATEEDRLMEYRKAIDLLTIKENHRLKTQISQLQTQHSEDWGSLKKEIDQLKFYIRAIGDELPYLRKQELQQKMLSRLNSAAADELQQDYQDWFAGEVAEQKRDYFKKERESREWEGGKGRNN